MKKLEGENRRSLEDISLMLLNGNLLCFSVGFSPGNFLYF